MKKFEFQLDTVLSYKRQVLDAAKAEYGAAATEVTRQDQIVRTKEQLYCEFNKEYRERQMKGITVADAMVAQAGLRAQEKEIQFEKERLKALRRRAEEKRIKMVEAKKGTATIEKLREKQVTAYNKAVQKEDEQFIDEFVSTSRIIASSE